MVVQLYSPARLIDAEAIGLLVLHFSRHLGGRLATKVSEDARAISPMDELRMVPLIFGLLPRSAIVRQRYDILVKPLITSHLRSLGIQPQPQLVDVLKEVADQYYRTAQTTRPRKLGIADLRAGVPRLYRQLFEGQNCRCAVCGISLSGEEETLDHVLPWRLAGEGVEGSNWRILCRDCNVGKSSFLSGLQPMEALNWIYDDAAGGIAQPNLRTRYIALIRSNACSHTGCNAGPRDSHLRVRLRADDALPIVDHARVYCQEHVESDQGAVTIVEWASNAAAAS